MSEKIEAIIEEIGNVVIFIILLIICMIMGFMVGEYEGKKQDQEVSNIYDVLVVKDLDSTDIEYNLDDTLYVDIFDRHYSRLEGHFYDSWFYEYTNAYYEVKYNAIKDYYEITIFREEES